MIVFGIVEHSVFVVVDTIVIGVVHTTFIVFIDGVAVFW